MSKQPKQLYMVVRVTTNEDSKILYVADLEQATLLGQLYMLEHPGQKCIAPPLEGRGFSKIEMLQLQYVFWNTFEKTPASEYAQLVQDCIAEAKKLVQPEISTASLMAQVAAYGGPISASTNTVPKAPKQPKVKAEKVAKEPSQPKEPRQPGDRPKSGSTTGMVWDILDKNFETIQDLKELRTVSLAEFINEGQSSSTFSVQFGKWKASKGL